MKLNRVLVASAATIAAMLAAHAASAGPNPVTATLSATYFEVADNSDPDFNTGSTPIVATGSMLGPNGLPVATGGVNDIGPGGQLTWWSPTLNSHVVQTSLPGATITLPYASNMFAPNSTGSSDSSFFETAIFSGQFDLTAPGAVSFNLQSDDDSFIYVDGVLIGQNPGVHALTGTTFSSSTLGAGDHTIEVFYADRQNVAAQLDLSLTTNGVTINPTGGVPEPSTWAMLILGVGMVGFAARRRGGAASLAG